MNKEEKANNDKEILALIDKVVEKDNIQNVALFIRGDAEYQNAMFIIKGDFRLLAQTIQHHITCNEEFKKFIYATVGSYLSQNPVEETAFLEGIKLTKQSFGVN